MANLIITQVPLGLRILTDTSDVVFNEFSVKRNNLSTDEIEIISDNKNNYAIFKIDFSAYTAVSFDGTVITTVGSLYTKLINVVSYSSPQSIDELSGSLNTVDYPHHEIHEGDAYILNRAITVGVASTEMRFQTPNTTKWAHFTLEISSTGQTDVFIYETTSKTHAVGNVLTPMNANRNSTNTSGLTICHTPAGSGDGSLLPLSAIWGVDTGTGAARKLYGGEAGGRNEIILKQNTAYLLRITSGTAGNRITISANWYEHTNL